MHDKYYIQRTNDKLYLAIVASFVTMSEIPHEWIVKTDGKGLATIQDKNTLGYLTDNSLSGYPFPTTKDEHGRSDWKHLDFNG